MRVAVCITLMWLCMLGPRDQVRTQYAAPSGSSSGPDYSDLTRALEENALVTRELIDASNRTTLSLEKNVLIIQEVAELVVKSNDDNVEQLQDIMASTTTSLDSAAASLADSASLLSSSLDDGVATGTNLVDSLTGSIDGATTVADDLGGVVTGITDQAFPRVDKISVSLDTVVQLVQNTIHNASQALLYGGVLLLSMLGLMILVGLAHLVCPVGQ
jgi:hypothetical protein